MKDTQQRAMVNLDLASSIGIVFDASTPANQKVVYGYADSFRNLGKEVHLIGYNPNIKKSQQHILGRESLNWFYKPYKENIGIFASRKYDILINAFIGRNLPLEYLATVATAKCRVGEYQLEKTHCQEFMVDIKGKTEIAYLLEQLTYFLTSVNK